MKPGSAEFARANERVKQLHDGAHCVYVERARKEERCQVRIRETIGFGDNAEDDASLQYSAVGIIGTGPTWPLAMEMAWEWRQDPHRKLLLRDRLPGDVPEAG